MKNINLDNLYIKRTSYGACYMIGEEEIISKERTYSRGFTGYKPTVEINGVIYTSTIKRLFSFSNIGCSFELQDLNTRPFYDIYKPYMWFEILTTESNLYPFTYSKLHDDGSYTFITDTQIPEKYLLSKGYEKVQSTEEIFVYPTYEKGLNGECLFSTDIISSLIETGRKIHYV